VFVVTFLRFNIFVVRFNAFTAVTILNVFFWVKLPPGPFSGLKVQMSRFSEMFASTKQYARRRNAKEQNSLFLFNFIIIEKRFPVFCAV
jgi:hypothetical protein